MSTVLSESHSGEVLTHVGSATSDDELMINLMRKKDAALILRKTDAVFSLACEVPEGDRSRGFQLEGAGAKPISFKRSAQRNTKKGQQTGSATGALGFNFADKSSTIGGDQRSGPTIEYRNYYAYLCCPFHCRVSTADSFCQSRPKNDLITNSHTIP